MPRSPLSAAILAVACACALVVGASCRRPAGSAGDGPVVVIAVDGVAWEVIAPLLASEKYPLIDWAEPLDPAVVGGWKPIGGRTASTGKSPDGGLWVSDSASSEPAGLTATIELDFPRIDRYAIEGRARGGRAPGQLTLSARYAFGENGPPARLVGNNETVCRTFAVGDEWTDLRLELQPPTTATTLSILLLSGEVDCVSSGFERVGRGVGTNPPVEVEGIRLLPGKIRGLPPGGFDRASLDAGGRLPNLARMVRNGVSGYLRTIEPTLSPVIWTSVATGEKPEDHGIQDFLMPAPGARGKMHVSSNLRRKPALWNILTDYGQRSVGVVSWWATWPAEAVRGFVLTDHANEAAVRLKEDRGYLPRETGVRTVYAEYDTYPRELAGRLHDQPRVSLLREDLQRLLPGLDDPVWRRFSEIAAVDRGDPESLLKFYLLKDLASLRVGLSLFEETSPDLWMIYFNGQDSLQHLFWQYVDPDIYPRVDRSLVPLYGQVVENYYALLDEFIGMIAAAAGPGANLMVLSDHGVHGVDFMQSGSRSGGHSWRSRGILVASGPAFKEGHQTRTASVFDIAPTVLGLLDYPVAEDLEGKALEQLLRPEWRRRHPIRSIDRYDFLSPRRGAETAVDEAFDEEVTARLRALGYLD